MKQSIMLVTKVTTKRIAILMVILFLFSIMALSPCMAGTWPAGGYQNISNTNNVYSNSPDVTADANGNPVAIWDEASQVYIAKYYDNWKPAKIISTTLFCSNPSITSDGQGIYAVWTETISGNQEIMFRSSLDGSVWLPTKTISNSTNYPNLPDIAADGSGRLYVVWRDSGKIYIRTSMDRGLTWGDRVVVTESSESSLGGSSPRLTCDGLGKLHLVYQNTIQPDPINKPTLYDEEIFYRSSANNGTTWSSSVNLSNTPEAYSQYPDIDVDAGNNVFIVWQEGNITSDSEILLKTKMGGAWDAATNLSASTLHDRAPAISWSRSGEMRIVWSHWQYTTSIGDRDIVGRIYRNGAWTLLPPQTFCNTNGIADKPCITDNGSGNPVVLWEDNTTGGSVYSEIFAAHTSGGFTLLSEGFEYNPLGTSSGWQVGDENTTGTACYWDEVTWTPHGGSKSAWCAGVNGIRDESALVFAYLPYMTAVMSRTFDLREYKDASISYWWRLPSSESGGFATDLGVLNLREGSNYLNDYWHNVVSTVWTQNSIDLTPYCGKVVTFTWRWVSDNAEQGEGLYIDDILLTGNVKEPADTIAPAQINNLAASPASTSSIKLTWTAPGDDSTYGTASSYDIRYSTSTLTSDNWNSSTQVTGEPTPSTAGTGQSFTVTGLSKNKDYYFAIKTIDVAGNVSMLSDPNPMARTISANGDINNNGVIDIADLVLACKAFGSTPLQPTWQPAADVNSNNFIDISDLVIISNNFGKPV